MCYSELQCSAVSCSVWKFAVTKLPKAKAIESAAPFQGSLNCCVCVLQRVGVRCRVLQCVAVCCSVLQCVALCCNYLKMFSKFLCLSVCER